MACRMDFVLNADNQHVTIGGPGVGRRSVMAALDAVTSYKVAGSHFSPSFKARKTDGTRLWDGKQHLLKYHRGTGAYRVPRGLLEDVIATLEAEGCTYELHDTARKPGKRVFEWNTARTPRPYQEEIVDILEARQGGIVKMSIRGGKTLTSARAIHRLQPATTVFITTSILLLHQSRAEIAGLLCLPVEDVGVIGEGVWEEKPITIASIQTLAVARGGRVTTHKPAVLERIDMVKGTPTKVQWCQLQYVTREDGTTAPEPKLVECVVVKPQDPRYAPLVKSTDLVFFDECHHLKGEAWRDVMLDFDSFWRVGLSATVYLDQKGENEKGAIWFKACCGPVRCDITMTQLINDGYLMRPMFWIVPVVEPRGYKSYEWSPDLRDTLIHENAHRNRLAVKAAQLLVHEHGMRTLIVAHQHNHIRALVAALEAAGLRVVSVTGKDKTAVREERVRAFMDRKVDVLVGNVLGEGVNLPDLEGVINVAGGKDWKAAIQRMRNLTKVEGKKDPIVVDLVDQTHPKFAAHAAQRLRAYKSEAAFRFQIRPL